METVPIKKSISGVALFVAGAATVLGAQQFVGKPADAAVYQRFQNEHTFVSRLSSDGGLPTYAGSSCGYSFSSDGGNQKDTCTPNGNELNDGEAKAFEVYLKARGLTPPR